MDNGFVRMMLLIFLVAYVVSPIDAVPGPIDDVILCLMYAAFGSRGIRTDD